MILLFDLIDQLDLIETNIKENIEISGITTDSRKNIPKDTLFICLVGIIFNAHDYISDVIERGAAAVIAQKKPTDETVPYILAANTRKTEVSLWMKWYRNPANNIKIIGITGTKGKSSVGLLLHNILRAAGYKTAFIGTFKNYIMGDEEIPIPADSPPSTPDSESLAKLFKQMNEKNIDYAIMDVSSHAFALDKVSALRFNYGIFTNLGHDHLDFHETMENYMLAKAKLFQLSDVAVMNYDDEVTEKIAALSTAEKYYFSIISNKADFYASDIKYIGARGDIFNLHFAGSVVKMCSSIHGKIYIYNTLAAAGVALLIGVPKETIYSALQEIKMPGRMEKLEINTPFSVYIDYAHTPNSLLGMLVAFKEIISGRVIVVFGCGGERDKKSVRLWAKLHRKTLIIV